MTYIHIYIYIYIYMIVYTRSRGSNSILKGWSCSYLCSVMGYGTTVEGRRFATLEQHVCIKEFTNHSTTWIWYYVSLRRIMSEDVTQKSRL